MEIETPNYYLLEVDPAIALLIPPASHPHCQHFNHSHEDTPRQTQKSISFPSHAFQVC